jgi:hypothetical protein
LPFFAPFAFRAIRPKPEVKVERLIFRARGKLEDPEKNPRIHKFSKTVNLSNNILPST